MTAQRMEGTGPQQIQDLTGTTTFTGQRRAPIVSFGASVLREANFASVRHNVGRWKHTMIRSVQYKMRGYNATTLQFEYWSTNNPSAGPPSGANLTNKAIAAVVVDSFPTNE